MFRTQNPPVSIPVAQFIAALSEEQMINILGDPQDPIQLRFYLTVLATGQVDTQRDLPGLTWIVDTMNMLTEAQVDTIFGLSG